MGLTAAPEDQALLLELQDLDSRMQRLAKRERELPENARLAELAAEGENARRVLSDRAGALEDARLELSRVESDVAVVEARIERDRTRLEGSSSVKDVQALETELASLARRRDELEEIELVVMERVEGLEAEVEAARAATSTVEGGIAETTAARDASLAELHGERDTYSAGRDTLAARVPADLLALYEKQRARYGIGASHLRGGVSTASGVALTATDLNAVRAAAPDAVLLCPESSAILVRTAESGL